MAKVGNFICMAATALKIFGLKLTKTLRKYQIIQTHPDPGKSEKEMKKQRNCRSDASPVASPRPAPSWSG